MALAKDPETAIRQSLTAMGTIPTFCGDVSVTTNAAALIDDAAVTSRYGCRRLCITNTSETATLGVAFVEVGDSFPSAIADFKKIMPLQTYEVDIGTNISVGCIGSGSLTANVLVHDVV